MIPFTQNSRKCKANLKCQKAYQHLPKRNKEITKRKKETFKCLTGSLT